MHLFADPVTISSSMTTFMSRYNTGLRFWLGHWLKACKHYKFTHPYIRIYSCGAKASRLTVMSREAKKKQPMRPYCEYFTHSTALKFVNTVAKLL